MFDGLNYKYEFETACESLMLESDGAQVRRTLIGVEWVLAEAIHGVFMLSAILQTVAAMFLVGWLLDFNSMDSLAKVIFGAVGIAMLLSIYCLLKFLLWFAISRHLKPRQFGDLLSN